MPATTAPSPPRWLGSVAAALRHRWTPAVLALAAFGVSLWVQQVVYPGLSWNRDEPVYLWHVDVLRHGQLTAPDGGRPTLYLPWLSAARDGEIFSQYTLGWPLALLVGALLGSTDLSVAGGTALAVYGSWALAHELFGDRLIAGLTGVLMLASPLVLVQSGTHLNYLFTLGLGLVFCTTFFAGVRLSSPWRLVTAGGLLGWIALTRPFDAVVWGLAALAYLLVIHRGRWATHLRGVPWFLAGLVPLVALLVALNLRLTGRPLEFPITVADPLDRFGFGDRRLMPRFGIVPYGKRMALEGLARNSFWLPLFLVGAHLGLVVAAAGAWLGRRRPTTWFLVALGLAFPAFYLPFFGTHISSLTARLSGPIYYIPAYFCLSALVAVALVRAARRAPRLAGGLGAGLLVVTAPIAVDRLSVNQQLSRANLPWAESTEHLDEPSIVAVSPTPYLLFLNPYSINGHDLRGEVVYAADAGPELLDLVADHPERDAYLQRASIEARLLSPSEDPQVPDISLTPLRVMEGAAIRLRAQVDPPDDAPVRLTWLQIEGGPASRYRRTTEPAAEEAWDLVPYNEHTTPSTFRIPRGLQTLHVVTGWGGSVREARSSPAVRRTYYVRSSRHRLEILYPGTVSFFEHPRHGTVDERSWIELLTTSYLAVEVQPLSASGR